MDLTVAAFRGETLDRLSAQLHESRAATKRGVENAMPLALAGLAEHARSERNAAALLQTFRSGDYPHVELDDVPRAAGDPAQTNQIARAGTSFLDRIFGERWARLVDAVSAPSGLSRSSATTLLGLALPIVLDQVGKEARARDLDAHGLSRFLAREEQRVSGLLPTVFASALGTPSQVSAERVGVTTPERRRRGKGWVWLVLALLAFIVLLFIALRSAKSPLSAPNLDVRQPEVAAPAIQAPEVAKPEATIATTAKPDVASRAPSRGPVTILSGSAEMLAEFLSSNKPTPRRFVIDGLNELTLDEVARVLQQHPSAKIRVEGETVKERLISKGVAADRIEAAGKTPEGRARNGAVEITVVER